MQIDKMIEVLQAYKDGKVIQFAAKDGNFEWGDARSCDELSWNFYSYEYRVKPEPKEFWINVYLNSQTGLKQLEVHCSKDQAEGYRFSDRIKCIHVREVLDE